MSLPHSSLIRSPKRRSCRLALKFSGGAGSYAPEEDLRSSWLAPSRGSLLSHATRGPSLSQRHEHGCPAPAHPALGRPVRNLQDLRYLRIGETLHVPQDQRSPVLHPHMPKRSLDLIAALRAQSRRLWVCVSSGRFRQIRHLVAAVLPLLPARLLLADAEAGVHCDLVEPGAKGALSPEPFYVSPDPDPDLLAGILGILCPEHA